MNRRAALVSAALAALGIGPPAARAYKPKKCPSPWIRKGDPIYALFEADLRSFARSNRHIHNAAAILHPSLTYLRPTTGYTGAWDTRFQVMVAPHTLPVPWVLLADCANLDTTTLELPGQWIVPGIITPQTLEDGTS